MFGTKKTLIVVYKDELLMNLLKKMVEGHDDSEESIVGTKDDSISIVSWTQKVWLENKKAGNIQGKILFLGDVKGTDKLIPVIDVEFEEYGVKYGWAGNQAVVYAEPNELIAREKYDAFLNKLSEMPVPVFLKTEKESISNAEHDQESLNENAQDENEVQVITPENNDSDENRNKPQLINSVKKAFTSGMDAIERVNNRVATKSEEVFRNKSLMKRQMLFYGVVNLYYSGLETFMNI